MRENNRVRLSLNREVVRELASADLLGAAGAQGTLPPTFCQCTGTETYTNVCCISVPNCIGSLPATQCNCTGTETANGSYCVC